MKAQKLSIFKRIAILIFVLITALCTLFMVITYLAATHFFQASTQLLNKDVAAHIAKFSSPFERDGINKRKADSVFQNAMVLSPSAEVYFLDTAGKVIAFHAPEADIKLHSLSTDHIKEYIASAGRKYIKGPDPKDPSNAKIFSAAEVISHQRKLGYIYVILGSNEYRNVSQMLFSSHVTNLVLEAFCIIILLSVLISLIYLNRIQQSFNRMIVVLKRFEAGDFEARFKIKEQHELAPVTQAFNNMADLLVYNINRLTEMENIRKDFIAHISHDLRTPLSIARGYTETLLIKKQQGAVSQQEWDSYIQMILNKILQVEHMVSQLFEISKMESVDFKLKPEPFVLSEIVQETVNTFQLNAREKHVDLKCTQCQYHVWINADIGMMERVIQNLIDNAVKNTPENGTVKVALSVENKDLIFSITNTGNPLPEELLDWINSTEKKHREHANRPLKTGLGLIILKKILELHGSDLKVEVQNNIGNIFSFSMPIYEPQPGI